MHFLKQSLKDFNQKIEEVIDDYQRQKDSYGWNFITKQESFTGTHYAMITSNQQATKILYDEETQLLTVSNFYSTDIRTILELQKQLDKNEVQ